MTTNRDSGNSGLCDQQTLTRVSKTLSIYILYALTRWWRLAPVGIQATVASPVAASCKVRPLSGTAFREVTARVVSRVFGVWPDAARAC